MEPATRIQTSETYAQWRAINEKISSLPKTEHGGVADPVLRDELTEQAQQHLSEINKGTHYQGEPVPSL